MGEIVDGLKVTYYRQVDRVSRDVRYAARSLRKSPAFAATAILTLALGIGANTAIFSALEGAVLAPLPYRQPDRLVMVLLYNRALKYSTYLSYPDFLDWQREARSFEQMAAFQPVGFDLTSPGPPEHVDGREVTSGFFDTLGVKLALGRTFSAAEDRTGGMPAAVISNRLWQRRFAGDRAALGKAITLNGTDYTLVGVLERAFRFEDTPAEVYTTLGRGNPLLLDRTNHGIASIARLAPGIDMGQARAEMSAVQEHIDQLNPATEKGLGTSIYPLKEVLVGDVGPTLLLLLAAVGLVLLIACANVANLSLARSAGRAREIAVRLALGASRAQIVRQLVTESVLLALAGGASGLIVAKLGLRAVLAAAPGSLPRIENIGLNFPVLLFALMVSMMAGVLFGLAPALKHSNADVQEGLKSGGRGATSGHHRTQALLAVVQIALALVLMSGASLLFRTIHNLWAVNPGFNPNHAIAFQVGLSPAFTETASGTRAAYRQLVERIRLIPGVEAADIAALLPFSHEDNSGPFWRGSRQPASMAEIPRARYYWTGPDYLSTLEIPLLRGRFVSLTDTAQSEKVIAIDSVLARNYFPDRDPIGETVTVPHWGQARIVGVVGHVEPSRLDGSAKAYDHPQIYGCFYQLSDIWIPTFRRELSMVVRTRLDPGRMMPAITNAVYAAGSDQPVYNVRTMQELVSGSMARQRFPMLLLVTFAVVALSMASIGIYGLISYSTAQRVPEIGIRMALGATGWDVTQMLVGQGLRLAVAGIAIGVAAALALARVVSSFSRLLYGVRATDAPIFGAVSLLSIAAVLLACYIPARRAARLEPTAALRHD
ncbi:MAG: ABC transporter permease [Bryobacteraceae bacterium]